MSSYFSNRNILRSFRKKLRNRSTSAESTLWNILKNRQLEGRKFRRQHSFGNYIVDFYCSEEKLIIELDGDPHGDYFKIDSDQVRDSKLSALGYRVLRFENKVVFQDKEYIIQEIKKSFKN